ncbi:TonB-dependent receptor plug domain-containing protein [Apibacter adventoris]|uniref:TonB-dependent receptor plug domain-containing protein n=1 Tax=Apibacter adventoris TaxID=1679466 RepID=UPI000CF6C803|nr:TonB-dependent receptor [Apibacter adventoris]PQL94930.1 TonB-dependent receptor [Apibacter adventoris]
MKKYYCLFVLLISVSNLFSQSEKDSLENDRAKNIEDVVITGTLKEVRRSDSPIPVEIITPKLFQKNPTPSLFDAVGMVNGVKPQLNCNVCNTGDIHINGMEGPYTLILIDGMPIVSGLSTVYGLSGIPNSIVERIEVVKGPAASLYGSEAMGGIINVITKNPVKAPLFSLDVFSTSWGEVNTDTSLKFKAGKKATSLLGINYFYYDNPIDNNHDGFTDLTIQNRISVFNKWNFERKENRVASLGLRWVNEDRWGGEMNWNKKFRGSDEVYGESIYTKRIEIIGAYQLPLKEKIYTQFSYNWHDQNSWYGATPYKATQQVAFIQTYWDKTIKDHNILLGASFRFTHYDDNTPATASSDGLRNDPAETPLPGAFIQDEWKINTQNKLLLGYRYDHDKNHGNIHSPRIAYKFSPNTNNTLRASFGTGFRVVNIFTEDHAALTGAREVIITHSLKPEKSYNGNLNYVLKIPTSDLLMNFDVTGFYSYFTNKIVGDFDTNPKQIIYDNLDGHAISQGISLNADLTFNFPLKLLAGITYMDVYLKEKDENYINRKVRQLHAPKWSGTFVATYTFPKNVIIDFTGQWNGPMRLPIEPNDYRDENSPWFCIANIQVTKKFDNGIEVYGGLKNLFNFIPKNPLMRPFDPFDKNVDDPVNNPNGYTFDTSYNYASLQGIHGFLGLRYNLF